MGFFNNAESKVMGAILGMEKAVATLESAAKEGKEEVKKLEDKAMVAFYTASDELERAEQAFKERKKRITAKRDLEVAAHKEAASKLNETIAQAEYAAKNVKALFTPPSK